MIGTHPAVRPARPFFSSGPCAKRPGWTARTLDGALLGRSHRSGPGKAKLKEAIDRTAKLLGVPEGYRVAIVPASDTGAMELAMWTMLGARPVDCFAWDSFGADWVTDAVKQLCIEGARVFKAEYGQLPDLSQADPGHDILFAWNGTTSGVRVPDADWIAADRQGISICDATSAAFAMDLAWDKLDAVTFSWQKALGGEAAHGMLVLSPRAVQRLLSYAPPRPLPKIFRLVKDGKLNEGVFAGETLNTPSMLALEDYLDTLSWAERIGGLAALQARVAANFSALSAWVRESNWIDFLAEQASFRSPTSVCLKITDPAFTRLDEPARRAAVKAFAALLEAEGVAFDVAGHANAPPGLRIWCGATVERSDIEALAPWLDWAWTLTRP
ncbi:MAG: phosphoserine transaminase [Alphaproteobacteria bacterium]|nr:phosphoserine transaminase [Alphaproteobacteria bacterium]MBV9692958.1 phosphoserine transaminase [Alphaproteobacteria bacterium]